MATLNVIRERQQSASAMRSVMDYCKRDLKVTDPDTGRRYVSGVNCDGENSYAEFMTTKQCFDKENGLYFYQYTQSFSPSENISPALAHLVAIEFAERAWPKHEVMVATHCDADHIHSHFVINSVSFVNGRKLRQSPNTLKQLRALNDDICLAHGLSVLAPYGENHKGLSHREYRAAVKGQSWKFRLMANIEDAMDRSGSKAEFIQKMSDRGYEVRWTNERKYITFTCPNEMKCRDIKLHEEKYLKEMMENEFRYREQKAKQIFDRKPHREEQGADADDRTGRGTEDSDDTLRKATGRDRADPTGGTVPAGAVQQDRITRDERESGRQHPSGRRFGRKTSEESDRETLGAVRGIDSEDAKAHRTGWEESREVYFGMLLGAESGAGKVQRTNGRFSEAQSSSADRGIPHSDSPLGAGILSALPRVSIIEDDSEDEEQRRKRIEAEQNGSDLGTALGLAIGLVSQSMTTEERNIPTDEYEDDEDFSEDFIPRMYKI
jgi:hypothetical protein